MKFAAIADIHGNLAALKAVLADIKAQGVTEIVNLGDLLSGPLEAGKVADLLMPMDLPTVRGNHERYLLTLPPNEMGVSDREAYDQLNRRHLSWLETIPKTMTYQDKVFLCHGTPDDDEGYFLEKVLPDGSVILNPLAAITAEAKGINAEVILCGHTHFSRTVNLADGRLVVNPGSVGLSAFEDALPVRHVIQSGTPDARYAILERGYSGWTVTHRLVPYDHMSMSRLAEKNLRPDWARALATGWMK
jgi:predicted phosphodiesterase